MDLDARQHAAREQFGRQSARYGKSHILADVSDVESALDLIPEGSGGRRALDVATGGGHTALCLARRGFRVTLSDLSEQMLEAAGGLLRENGHVEEGRFCHKAEEFPFADGSMDLVTCRVAAHHFSEPEKFVAESARVLRPGGAMVVIDGSIDDGFPVAEEWTHSVEKLRDPSHGRFLSPNWWRGNCELAGFTVISCLLCPMKMPDLNWYFETAATSMENRKKVLELVEGVPLEAKKLFRVQVADDGTISWFWRRLTLVALRPQNPNAETKDFT